MEQRSILFRGKRTDTNKWEYGAYLPIHKMICIERTYPNSTEYMDFFVEPETVGQFTGQYDTCGNRIFEGDIVYCAEEDENAEIKWDEETSRFVIEFYGWISDFDSFYGRDLEVVGNIFDEVIDNEVK